MGRVQEQIQEKVQSGDYEFALDSSKAIIRQTGGGGGNARPEPAPAAEIRENRLVADTDPDVKEGINTFVDYLVGSGFSIQPANIPGADTEQTDEDIADLKRVVEASTFESVLGDWVWHALVDGTAFLEIVVENDHFRPKVLPTRSMEIQTDEFGNTVQYIQQSEGGDEIEFAPSEIAVLRFHRHPDEDFGHSIVEAVKEQADILRDMEIDTARFVATKAYPPILWQCGTDERPWTQKELDDWLAELDSIEPESMLAVGHDVDAEPVGVTSTSSTAGAMRLEETFKHFEKRVATGLGLPAPFLNQDQFSGNELQAVMKKFDRRVQRYRTTIKQAVRYQVFPSILGDSTAVEYNDLLPEFEFGKHSSEEERLDAKMAIQLVNNGLLTREAAAKRLGIDPETELPQEGELEEQIETINQLAGRGDDIQNPDGGRPTDSGGGTQSPGREATTREDPTSDNSGNTDRPQQSPED